MGVSDTTNRQVYSGDGSSASFAFSHYFFNQTDLKVYLYDSIATTTTLQTLNTNYSISGTPNAQGLYTNGATVIMNSSPNVTSKVVIYRDPPEVQNFSLQQNGTISSAAIVQQMDYLTLLVQRLEDQVSRSVALQDGFGGTFSGLLPNTTILNPGAVVVVNSSGTGLDIGIGGSSVLFPVGVPQGGTGNVTLNQFGLLVGNGPSAIVALSVAGTGTVLQGTGSSNPQFLSVVTLGAVGANTGVLKLQGNVSGLTSIRVSDTAGTYNLNLPTTSGSSGQVLTSAGGGSSVMTWSTPLSNPMTDAGQMIYGAALGFPTQLPSGLSGQFLQGQGSSAPVWTTPTSVTASVATKTANYNMVNTDNIIIVGSSNFTINTYAPSGNAGKTFQIYAGAVSGSSNVITIAGSSCTIGGVASLQLYTPGDFVNVFCDGTNFQLLGSKISNFAEYSGNNGFGSTASAINKFSSVVQSIGNAFTIANDATNGFSCTINLPGTYFVSHGNSYNGAAISGISKNSASVTAAIDSIGSSAVLALAQTAASDNVALATWSGPLSAGDIIRPHSNGQAAGANPGRTKFWITRLN